MRFAFALLVTFALIVGTFAASPVRQLLGQNRLEEALALCRQFEVLETNDQDNYLACAWVYYRSNMNGPAEKLVEKASKSFSLPEYQLLLAYARFKAKRLEDALQTLDSIARMNKGSRVGMAAEEIKAEVYEEKGQLDTAAFIYKGILKDDANRGRAHWGLGRFYLAKGEVRKAVSHMEKTAKLWPKHSASRYNLGVIYLGKETENLAEAQKWLLEAYRLNKADADVLEQIGLLFERRGKLNEAVKHWQKAVDIKKDATIANEKLASYAIQLIDALMEQKKWDEALRKIDKAGKSATDQPKIVLRRGIIYRNLARYDKAVVDLQGFLAGNPKNALALREVGIAYLNMRVMDQAQSYFTRALAEEPNEGVNYAWMGFVLEAKGDFTGARDAWKRASELIKEPADLERAVRRLASVEARIKKNEKKEEAK